MEIPSSDIETMEILKGEELFTKIFNYVLYSLPIKVRSGILNP